MRKDAVHEWVWEWIAALRCIERMGVIQACKYWMLRGRRREFQVQVRDYSSPFYLRGQSSDPWVFRHVIINEQYGAGLASRSINTIVDAGANAGYATRYFKKLWPDAHVVLLEPDSENVRLIAKNLRHVSGTTVLEAGLWSDAGRAAFVAPNDAKYALRLQADPAGDLETTTIEALLDRMKWDRIDLLKLDIEGAERELMGANAIRWIERVGMIAVELHEGIAPGCAKALFDALQGVHFTLEWHGENLFIDLTGHGQRLSPE